MHNLDLIRADYCMAEEKKKKNEIKSAPDQVEGGGEKLNASRAKISMQTAQTSSKHSAISAEFKFH